MNQTYSKPAWALTFIFLALIPALINWLGEPFYLEVIQRILILAIAVASLDLLVGYGGMISLGHAAYLGIGSYAVGILAYYGIDNGFLQVLMAMAGSACFALLVGAVSLRVRGAYFIMITLAFCQLLYFLSISLTEFGGDDGLILSERSSIPGLDLYEPLTFYYLVWSILLIVLLGLRQITQSRFGRVLEGSRQNEKRMAAIGIKVYRYQLTAFVIAGTICGIAGVLLANHEEFISPSLLHWSHSGDLLVMAIIGGVGSLLGAIWGVFAYTALEIILARYSEHWHLVFGPCLVLLALFTRKGLLDLNIKKLARNKKDQQLVLFPVTTAGAKSK